MEIWAEPDSDDSEVWVSIAGDDLALTESSTWPLEMYVAAEAEKE